MEIKSYGKKSLLKRIFAKKKGYLTLSVIASNRLQLKEVLLK